MMAGSGARAESNFEESLYCVDSEAKVVMSAHVAALILREVAGAPQQIADFGLVGAPPLAPVMPNSDVHGGSMHGLPMAP